MSTSTLVYGVEDKPKWSKLLVFAFQQVLAVLSATIAVPTIIGLPVQIPAAILGAGLGTICYLLFTKFKSPVVISSSFAFLTALANAVAFGYMGIVLGSIFAGLVYVIIAILVKFLGSGWVNKLMPPVIIGPTVALIGLSLAGSAMSSMVSASGFTDDPAGLVNGGYNLIAIFCGLVTFLAVVICSVQNRFKNARLLPFIIGIGAGYLVASMFSIIGYATNNDYFKIINWNALIDNFKNFSFTSILDYPRVGLVEGIKELANGAPSRPIIEAYISNSAELTALIKEDLALLGVQMADLSDSALMDLIRSHNFDGPQLITGMGIAQVALAFVPVALVTFAEHIADHKNLSSIIDRDLLDEPGLSRTLLGDGVGSIVGTIGGICPNTTYGESVGCVAITKNASVRTILVAACMLIVLSFLTPINKLLMTIPSCVMGGVCLTLYGFIAVSGLKMFKEVDLSESKNLFTVAAILISGIGGLAIQIPYALESNGAVAKTIQITSIATALLLGILTHFICEIVEKRNKPEENQPSENEAE